MQDIRIAQTEKDIHNIQERLAAFSQRIEKLEKRGGDVALKWIGIIGSGLLTIILGYIAVKVGLK